MKLGLRARKTKCEKVSKQLLPPLDHRKWKKEEEKGKGYICCTKSGWS